jgi:exodeoxyribonuclease VII small subunit
MSEPADIAALTFEQALAELEQIVAALESPGAAGDSIGMYERGAALKAHCEARRAAAAPAGGEDRGGRRGAPGVEPAEFG